ncbi:MAG: hypothetical protein HY273_03305 [Gammaproteobacteria bacterium]|nr:hypothetical protein [Gammaproteobacteria bacterium]
MIRSLLNLKQICCVLVPLLLVGCATMFDEGQQQVALRSATGQAVDVRVHTPRSGEYRATLPTIVTTKASSFDEFTVAVDDPCFEPLWYVVDKSTQPIYFLNLLNLHGFYIDYFSGSMWQYNKHVVIPARPRSTNAEGCTTPLPLPMPVTSEPEPKPLIAEIPKTLRHEIGIGNAPLRIHTSGETSGFYLHYNFQPKDLYRFQLRLMFNSSSDPGNQYWLDYDQTVYSAAIHVTPFPTQGVYLGAGVAAAFMRVTYNSYGTEQGSNYVELKDKSTPLFFELGWKTAGRININVFANVSLQTLGLSPPPINVNQEKLARISNLEAREQAARQFKHGSEYSAVGLGLGWKF